MMVASSVPGSPKPHASEEVLWLSFPNIPPLRVPTSLCQGKGLGWWSCAPGPSEIPAPGALLSLVGPLIEIKGHPGRWEALGDEHLVGRWGDNRCVGCQSL